MTEKKFKKLKSLIGFHSADKINSYNRGGWRGKKKSKRIYRTSQNIRIINVFLESLLSVSFPLLGVTASAGECPPTLCLSLYLLWGQLSFYSDLPPVCSCLQCSQLLEPVYFLLWELSMSFYIFHRRSLSSWLCGFNLQLVQLVGRFWVFFPGG